MFFLTFTFVAVFWPTLHLFIMIIVFNIADYIIYFFLFLQVRFYTAKVQARSLILVILSPANQNCFHLK